MVKLQHSWLTCCCSCQSSGCMQEPALDLRTAPCQSVTLMPVERYALPPVVAADICMIWETPFLLAQNTIAWLQRTSTILSGIIAVCALLFSCPASVRSACHVGHMGHVGLSCHASWYTWCFPCYPAEIVSISAGVGLGLSGRYTAGSIVLHSWQYRTAHFALWDACFLNCSRAPTGAAVVRDPIT